MKNTNAGRRNTRSKTLCNEGDIAKRGFNGDLWGGLQRGQIFCTHFAIKYPFPCFFIFLLTFLETFAPSRLGAKLPLGRLQQGFIIETGLLVCYYYTSGILFLKMNQ